MRLLHGLDAQIDMVFAQLGENLRELEVPANSDGRAEQAAGDAVRFLRRHQNPNGSWALGAMLNTNMALQALGLWDRKRTEWETEWGKGGLELAWEWLESEREGAKWENVWNTAGVIRGALYFGQMKRRSVADGLDWLVAQGESGWGVKNGDPLQHVSQALLLFNDLGMSASREQAGRWLIDGINEALSSTSPPLSPYTSGQALEALAAFGFNAQMHPADVLVRSVSETLLGTHVSISNFLDVCSAFKGLGALQGGLASGDEALEKTVGNFLSDARRRPDGSWYRDLTFTSFGLIALTEVRGGRRVEGYPQQVYGPIEKARRETNNLVRKEVKDNRQVALLSGLIGALLVALVVVLDLQLLGGALVAPNSGVGWFVAPVLLTVIGALAKFVWTHLESPGRKP